MHNKSRADAGRQYVVLCFILSFLAMSSNAQQIPEADRRADEIRHLDLPYSFTAPATKEVWLARAQSLRQQILVSAGLWPMPEKTPLNAQIFGLSDKGDYTVEKVYFASTPGHYVTGNLYRPKNVPGKAPGVLCPHGHWQYGRLENQQLNSGPARAANFAKLGFVAFTWDMVGYNDSIAVPHTFASHKEALVTESLWGVNLLGLQLWNSIRALDFLQSLPEVDPERIGVTGESGGGTQTFLLSAVDDRIKVSAPVNMISFIMQGGSVCENAPNLRIDTNNVEIGALMAPRPMLMVAATGDWTKNTPTSEYPAIKGVYKLFGAEDKVQTVQFDSPHNYHRESREAVYGWFAHWLQGRKDWTPIKEKGYGSLTLPELLVFYGRTRPTDELDEKALTTSLIEQRKKQLDAAWPRDAAGLDKFREQFGTTLKYALMAEYPKPDELITAPAQAVTGTGSWQYETLQLSRRSVGDSLRFEIKRKEALKHDQSFVLLTGYTNQASDNLIAQLASAGHTAIRYAGFAHYTETEATRKLNFRNTYNRSESAQRVQDLLTVISYLKSRNEKAPVILLGSGQAGLEALLARALAPLIDRMIVDVAQFDNTSDTEFLKQLAIPDIRRAGDFAAAVMIAPKTPLLIHNTGNRFRTDRMAEAYRLSGKAADLQVNAGRLTDEQIIEWLKQR